MKLVCLLVGLINVSLAAFSSSVYDWKSFGPSACSGVLHLEAAVTPALTTKTSVVVITFSSVVTFLYDSGTPRLSIGTGTGSNSANALIAEATSSSIVSISASGSVLTITGIAVADTEYLHLIIGGLCVNSKTQATYSMASTANNVVASQGTLSLTAYAANAVTALSWTSGAGTVGVEENLVLGFTPQAAFGTDDWVVVTAKYVIFGSGCTCQVNSLTVSSTNVCARDYVAFQPGAAFSIAAGALTCTKATPYVVRASDTSGLCLTEFDNDKGFTGQPDAFLCATLPAAVASVSPTASPSTAACAGGGSAAAAAGALWAAAPATSPVAAVIMSIAAVCGALLA